jgi:two-component system sensor histidine kinase HydH
VRRKPLQQFFIGFVVAAVVVLPVCLLFLWKNTRKIHFAQKRYTEQIEQLSKLAAGLAHEIKNPLSIIKINLKLITEDWDKSDERFARSMRKIGVVQKETDRLQQILDDFLRYTGKSEIHPVSSDINQLVGEVVDFYSPQADGHSITVRVVFSKEKLLCKVDADMIKQVILNLFINAQQAMTTGGELMIKTGKNKNEALIEIGDTGSGIEPDKLDKVFDAYYSSRPAGTGLGLPTARKIIDAHNGNISVVSELGKGTLFTIKLPLYTEQG